MRRYTRIWELWQVNEIDDEAGGTIESEKFVKKVPIVLNPIQGTRALQFSQVIDGKPYTANMRIQKELDASGGNLDQIKKDYFLKQGERELIIHDVLNVEEDSRYLDLLVWEKA